MEKASLFIKRRKQGSADILAAAGALQWLKR